LLTSNQTLSIRNTINAKEKSPVLKLKSFSLAFGAQVFKALGDESRLRILHLLYHMKSLTITDMELILDFTQTKTARLMGVMRNAGLVQSSRTDYWVFYRIKDEATGLLADYLQLMEKDPQLVEDLKLGRTLESNRELIANKIAMKQYKPVFHS
jgi:ArsR family transcriptional regulator